MRIDPLMQSLVLMCSAIMSGGLLAFPRSLFVAHVHLHVHVPLQLDVEILTFRPFRRVRWNSAVVVINNCAPNGNARFSTLFAIFTEKNVRKKSLQLLSIRVDLAASKIAITSAKNVGF